MRDPERFASNVREFLTTATRAEIQVLLLAIAGELQARHMPAWLTARLAGEHVARAVGKPGSPD